MVYREHGMWEVLEVLVRLHRGESQVAVQAATGRDRKTVRSYLKSARELGWEPGTRDPDEALAATVVAKLRPGPRVPEAQSENLLRPHEQRIRDWLAPPSGERRGLKLTKVHQLLLRQGIEVPYSSLHRFAVHHCGFGGGRGTVRCAPTQPGEVSQFDFGRLGYIFDPIEGCRRLLYALIVVLIHSRHMYVHVTRRQTIFDVIDGIEAAWEFFSGVTRRMILDNLSAAISKADRFDPIFQRTFSEYGAYRGFVIDPAPPEDPTAKPHVERMVPYVRENFFRGESFLDQAHVQREAIRWCRDTAGLRIHGTTGRRPLPMFEEEERSLLLPLIGPRFDTPHWAECTVHPDHHVQFRKALYSVPTAYLRQKVTVRGDRSLVRIYLREKLIKTHQPQKPGGRSTDYDDYPKVLAAYARRDPDRVIADARQLGANVGRFAEQLLAGDFPWSKLRQAQKLLRLAQKYGTGRLEEACARALAFELINVRRLEDIVTRALRQPPAATAGVLIPLPSRFLRHEGSFTHQPPTPKEVLSHGDQTLTEHGAQAPQALGDPGDPAGPRGLRQESPTEP